MAQFHIDYDALIVISILIQRLRNTYRYIFYSLRVHIVGVRNRNRNVNVNVNALIFNTPDGGCGSANRSGLKDGDDEVGADCDDE